MRRKADLSISVIIAIALGLLVLIILAILVGTNARKADQTINNCEGLYAGKCWSQYQCIETYGGRVIAGAQCPTSTEVCCVGFNTNSRGQPEIIR